MSCGPVCHVKTPVEGFLQILEIVAALQGFFSLSFCFPQPIMPPCFQELPQDIIREIASHSLPEFPWPTNLRPPLSLCHISSVWRHTVQSSPEFWSTLFVRTRAPNNGNYSRLINQIIEWFRRAKNRPLSFFLSLEFYGPDGDKFERSPHEDFLVQLSPIVARTRHLGLSSNNMAIFLEYLSSTSLRWNVDVLDSLDIASNWLDGIPPSSLARESTPIVDLFKDARRLRHVSIHGDFFNDNILHRKLVFPLSNLTTIVIEELLDDVDWDYLIQTCPRVRYCDVCLNVSWFDPPRSYSRLLRPDLQILRLGAAHRDSGIFTPIETLELPSLHTLHLYEDITDALLISPQAFNFQYFHCLRSLIISSGWVDGVDGMIQLFQRTVNVKELTLLASYNILNSLFQAISYTPTNRILPRLTSLRVHIGSRTFDADTLGDMIKSRSVGEEGCKHLQSFAVALTMEKKNSRRLANALQDVLMPYSAAGLSLNLTESYANWDQERSHRRAFRGTFDDW